MNDNEKEVRLESEDIRPFLSPYLSGGWRDDYVDLRFVEVSRVAITGHLQVLSHFTPSDGQFHFTVPLAFLFVAQLAIIHTCWEHGLREKSGEVYLRSIEIICKRRIARTDDVQIRLVQQNKRYLPHAVLIEGAIDVDGGAFVGQAKYLFPLAPEIISRFRRDRRRAESKGERKGSYVA